MQVLHNAKIFSLDAKNTQYQALAIADDKILAAGSEAEILSAFEGRASFRNLEGRTVIPGLIDAHIHLMHYALGLARVDCETITKAECLRRISQRAQETPPGNWILGHGWNQNVWPEGFGSAADLDTAAPHHPVYLSSKSLHSSWVNSKALRAAQIDANTRDPLDGKIERTASGNPTGILFEGASNLVLAVIPEPTPAAARQALQAIQPVLWQMGLTGVHDFDRRACFMGLQALHSDGLLQLRVLKSLPLESLSEALEIGLQTGFGDDWLRIGGVKCFTDGALGPHTAAMLQPYENDHQKGMLIMDEEELFEKGKLAAANGLALAIHAIGDRANHETLNALEKLRQIERPNRPLRHRIEHVQLLHPQDLGRLAELNIIASMQPIHATSDMVMADDYWGKRAAYAYAWKSQLAHGARLAFGSDAPVESPNPFWGLHAAITRQRQDGSPGEDGWYPEQRLDRENALRAYTSGAAYAANMENRLGQLSPGYLADLLVLETDPFTCPPTEIYRIKPQATMVGGQWVFER